MRFSLHQTLPVPTLDLRVNTTDRQHTMSKLSRAIRFIMFIWFLAFCLAIPQACQFGVVVNIYGGSTCTVN